ncbi:IS3 family transposase [Dyadobacter frigoris]|uniref:IS3 family transposase n=1 Tax=Dyadobacter frigoris TaxID=2576211 RepID=A0A4U6CR24_9BACT|nr:IS3 family transposase [Dyadobacter frigoris]TKT85308.1 IS3 family transposase [Dyadobacter frigoris]
MRQEHPQESLGSLCELFGVTRQAFYDAAEHEKKTSIAHMLVLSLVREYRIDIPLIGTRKLLFLLIPDLKQHGIRIGRDQLFELLRFHGLLIRRRRRIVKTTDSHHWLKKYPNLIKGLVVTGSNQLWVSDLTYIRTLEGFSYLSLITDAFSRKIVGHALYHTLEAVGCINALKMAIEGLKRDSPYFLIHHSDRGIQYCSAEYVSLLEGENIAISMTQSGSPYDNALAERVNGIIKNEFFPKRVYQNHKEGSKAILRIIQIYNSKRPHASVDYLTPEQAHEHEGLLAKRWKQYRRKKSVANSTEA